ncbi:MAG: caspase family protein [Cyanobacteria bacterium]|nr:caspase family protein [Cyanobacteriota bacterium]MDW8201275.1 caspase family protein [Cyanobacteriota bacterium SKYGB_h_bin112]
MMVNPSRGGNNSHWAVVIGINRYARFQPLIYAQNDAQAVWTFLVKEADLSVANCVLMTDTSSAIQEQSTYPTRQAIQQWVSKISQQAVPGDTIWCFFSGYGVCHQGQDYLMPIDGSPADIPGTGIAIQSLFQSLQAIAGVRVIVLLDINRSQAMQVGATVGSQAMILAQQHGVCLVLSCQPDEFSHESHGHGLFTTTLLEGLRHPQCTTLDALRRYLTVNLPKLGTYYSLPSQHPVVVMSPELATEAIITTAIRRPLSAQTTLAINGYRNGTSTSSTLPKSELYQTTLELGSEVRGAAYSSTAYGSNGQGSNGYRLEHSHSNGSHSNGSSGEEVLLASSMAMPERSSSSAQPEVQWSQPSSTLPPTPMPSANGRVQMGVQASQSEGSDPPIGYSLPINSPEEPAMTTPSPLSHTPDSGSVAEEDATDGKFWPRLLIWGGIALVVLLAGVILRNAAGLSSKQPLKPSSVPTASPTAQPDASNLQPPADPALLLSFNALKNNQPEQALQLLDNLPPDRQRSQEYKTLRNLTQQRLSRVRLSEAQEMVTGNQAIYLRRAIDHLQTIPPSDPSYPEAQRTIDRWSFTILDIAEGRARKGDYGRAIAAAKLVPESSPVAYRQAQQRLAEWPQQAQQLRTSQEILSQATARAKGSQASAYNQAIRIARQIRPGDPLYQQAEERIALWSQRILKIGRSRAEEGKLRQAMAAFRLVPSATVAYADAQQEIELLSKRILDMARNSAASGNYRQAIALAGLVPPSTSSYAEAQANLQVWKSRSSSR